MVARVYRDRAYDAVVVFTLWEVEGDLFILGGHPWMQFAGMFQNDPQFEEMQADIQVYRQEIDREGN
jgi:hypothetical protein